MKKINLLAVVLMASMVTFAQSNSSGNSMGKIEKGTNKPRTGEILYFNVDSVNEHYVLVKDLMEKLESERSNQQVVFQKRQSVLEDKLQEYEEAFRNKTMNQSQLDEFQRNLSVESQVLQDDYSQMLEEFEIRYAAVLKQITDSVEIAVKRINAERNASYIMQYQYGGVLIDPDPSKDITNELLEILNEPFKKEKPNTIRR